MKYSTEGWDVRAPTVPTLLRELAHAIEQREEFLRLAWLNGRKGRDGLAKADAATANRWREEEDTIRAELRRRFWRP